MSPLPQPRNPMVCNKTMLIRHAERPVGDGLGTRIAARFRGIGLREGEEIPELQNFAIKSPFEE